MLIIAKHGPDCIGNFGPPRIKLFPEIANALLPDCTIGVKMNPLTSKLVIPLPKWLVASFALPIKTLYVLQPPEQNVGSHKIAISPLSQREVFISLLANTFNTVIQTSHRIRLQFDLTTRLACTLTVKSLSYSRDLSQLPAVVNAIRSDVT
jgi:hypothetical protein